MAGKAHSLGLEDVLASHGVRLSEVTFRAPETPQERTARIAEEAERGRQRRRIEWMVARTIVGVVTAVSLACLAVILWPGRDPDAVKLAFASLSSVLTGLFGILAGRGMKAGEG